MIVYLAALKSSYGKINIDTENVYLLSSFWELRAKKDYPIARQNKHILDSGAFSAFSGKNNGFDWDNYVKQYAQFIIANGNKLFFELDIDIVVGLAKVEYYRKYLEDRTGISPIPVWHASRGKDYFLRMCEQYPYVAIGTTGAMEEGKRIRKNPMVLKWFIDKAHQYGKKIHGLGFTDTKFLPYLNFDSVDSTTWLSGGRYGQLFKFNETKGIVQIFSPPKGKRAINHRVVNQHNINEWIKYQKYAEKYL